MIVELSYSNIYNPINIKKMSWQQLSPILYEFIELIPEMNDNEVDDMMDVLSSCSLLLKFSKK